MTNPLVSKIKREGMELCPDGRYRKYPDIFTIRVTRSRLKWLNLFKPNLEVILDRMVDRAEVFEAVFEIFQNLELLETLIKHMELKHEIKLMRMDAGMAAGRET